ncbi:hypothetical protein KAR91_28420 [Candidatus Pacearchaeota archaeon]|nr:hypothetical protein [Candidatus Pacearchaeota archaeon]
MSWYAKSYAFIQQQKLDNPNMPHKELRRHCSKNYPFRERSGHAYKMFLKAMRDVFGATRKKKQPEGQGELL